MDEGEILTFHIDFNWMCVNEEMKMEFNIDVECVHYSNIQYIKPIERNICCIIVYNGQHHRNSHIHTSSFPHVSYGEHMYWKPVTSENIKWKLYFLIRKSAIVFMGKCVVCQYNNNIETLFCGIAENKEE